MSEPKCGCRVDYVMDGDPELLIVRCPLHQAAPAMLAMLKRLEWSGARLNPMCPECCNYQSRGHAPDCSLASLLAAAEGAGLPRTTQGG